MKGWGFEFGVYARPFRQPLKTAHGVWESREGIILRLANHSGEVRLGEIAPVPWFGSETLEEAVEFCRQLPTQMTAQMTDEMIRSIPEQLPACQFGFESAVQPSISQPLKSFSCSHLLPAGVQSLSTWEPLWEAGYRTFKWKIGVDAIAQELEIFHQLIQLLPPSAHLRLDANGALSYDEALLWLQACDDLPPGVPGVEYLEQPLAPEHFEAMQALSQQFRTAIALDESVANLTQLQACYQKGWRGVFVIKPAIAGSPAHLRQFCQETGIDVVVSSVFETAIGQKAALHLAADLVLKQRAIGFGLDHWFPENDLFHRLEGDALWEWLCSNARLTGI